MRAHWTALDVQYIYTSPIPTFLSVAGVTVAAAARSHTDISTIVVKKVELNHVFYVYQKKESSEAISRKGCPSDRAASISPKGLQALSFCREHCDFFFFLIFCWPWISIYLFININQLDALNFLISLFQASTCFERMCSSSGGQNFNNRTNITL